MSIATRPASLVLPITRRIAALTAAALVGVWSPSVSAQSSALPSSRWEVRVASGSLMPTGEQRESLRSGSLTAAQVAWLPQPSFAVIGSFGWARSRDLKSIDAPKLNAFSADLGVEARPMQWMTGQAITFTPFIGFGAGARSYDYRGRSADATHNLAGYGAVGGELGFGKVGLRLEARNYVSGFKPLTGAGTSDTRNDVSVLAAVRFNRRAAKNR